MLTLTSKMQLSSIKQMESLIIKKQVHAEKLLGNQELALLLKLLQRKPIPGSREIQEDTVLIKLTALSILAFVYEHKFLKTNEEPRLGYHDKIETVIENPPPVDNLSAPMAATAD